jgi:hypothetical protein
MEVFPFDHTMESLESGVETSQNGIHWDPLGSFGIHWDVESSPVRSGQGTSSWRRLVSRTLSSRNMWRSQIASKMGSSWMEKLGNHGALMYLFIYVFIYLYCYLFDYLSN